MTTHAKAIFELWLQGRLTLNSESELTKLIVTCQELPHKRIVRNLRRLLTDIADKPAEREKHLEQLLLILPRGSADPLKVVRPVEPPKEEDFPEDDEEEAGKTDQAEGETE